MGLGVHGGGVASAKWLLSNGAEVTITDLRTREALQSSIKKFTDKQKSSITFVLGRHREVDFKTHDIVLVNPAIPRESELLTIARTHGKDIQNDTSLFFRFVESPIIGITGTRGKTTTTNWLAQILSQSFGEIVASGNTPDNALLKEIRTTRPDKPVVAELSSWQLELLPASKNSPHISVITNIYPDHLNRYKNITAYAHAKANIFKDQTSNDFLILNADNDWTEFFLKKKPQAAIFFVSMKKLPKRKDGLFLDNNTIIFQKNGVQKKISTINSFEKKWGAHNVENVLTAILSALLFHPSIPITKKLINSLGTIRFRQEHVYSLGRVHFINDTTATSPDALISSLHRFAGTHTYFLVGGTDKKLSFKECAMTLREKTDATHTFFLAGSATEKLLRELRTTGFFSKHKPLLFNTLEECVREAYTYARTYKSTIVLSPGASSFEKFNNEFHRGEQYEKYIRELS